MINSFDKERLLISVLLIKQLIFNIKNINITIIKANIYYITCYLKRTWIFFIIEKF